MVHLQFIIFDSSEMIYQCFNLETKNAKASMHLVQHSNLQLPLSFRSRVYVPRLIHIFLGKTVPFKSTDATHCL